MTIVYLFGLAGLGVMIRGFFNTMNFGSFAYGTLVANVLGSFLIGALYARTWSWAWLMDHKTLITLALLGGLTTFSSFALDGARLLEKGQVLNLFLLVFLHNFFFFFSCFAALRLYRL
ncbi:MAG: CrcB family protein [Bdellovibrionales bacterium]